MKAALDENYLLAGIKEEDTFLLTQKVAAHDPRLASVLRKLEEDPESNFRYIIKDLPFSLFRFQSSMDVAGVIVEDDFLRLRQIVQSQLPPEWTAIDYVGRDYQVERHRAISHYKERPIGQPGGKLSVSSHLVCLPTSLVTSLVEDLRQRGINAELMTYAVAVAHYVGLESFALITTSSEETSLITYQNYLPQARKIIYTGKRQFLENIGLRLGLTAQMVEPFLPHYLELSPEEPITTSPHLITVAELQDAVLSELAGLASMIPELDLPVMAVGQLWESAFIKNFFANQRKRQITTLLPTIIGAGKSELVALIGALIG